MADHQAVLDFWFGPVGDPDRDRPRDAWFRKDPEFDAVIRARFESPYLAARQGALAGWLAEPEPALALTILLDQFPRNMYRGGPRMFESDAHALECARTSVERGHDRGLPPVWRWFFYLPFEHAEDVAAQRTSLSLFEALRADRDSAGAIAYAHRHAEIVERFGRFPHRNVILGRASTPQEVDFLGLPGSSF